MLDAGDADINRPGCRLEELLVVCWGRHADRDFSTASLRMVLRKLAGGEQINEKRVKESSLVGTCWG